MLLHRTGDRGEGAKNNSLRRAAYSVAALFLMVLIVMVPLEPAFAQSSADASAKTNSDAATSGTSSLGPDQKNVDTSTAQPSTTGNGSSQTDATTQGSTPTPSPSPVSPPAPAPVNSTSPPTTVNANQGATKGKTHPLPENGLGSPNPQPVISGSFNQDRLKIDKNTGALDTTYPISIPPGRNNLQPDVDLVYNSQNTQFGSIVGEGWSISIPYIERLNKTGVDNLYSTSTLNYFMSSLDGELVSTTTVSSTGSTYVARTENGAFNQYAFSVRAT